jgi:hypothetical protein
MLTPIGSRKKTHVEARNAVCILTFEFAPTLFALAGRIGDVQGSDRSFKGVAIRRLTPETLGRPTDTKFNGGEDGKGPVAGLAFDTAGNLYGTTEMGGGTGRDFQFGCGTAFELIPETGGEWKERVLRRFQSNEGGKHPLAGLFWMRAAIHMARPQTTAEETLE